MNIKETLQKLVESGNELYAKIAEVTTVDIEAKTCDVKPIDGTSEIFDVFLNLDETTGQFREPAIGALICVVFITKETAVAVNYSELKQHNIKIQETEFTIDESGFLLKKADENLAKLMDDLLKEILQMKFTTNTGSTIALVNSPEFKAIQTRFKTLLKDN